MYNNEQKQRYLNYCTNNRYEESTVELLEKIFNSTEMSENQFKKDVSAFNQIEVTDFLTSLNSKSQRRLQTTCVFLSEYYQWCYNEGLIDSIVNPFDSRIVDAIITSVLPSEMLNQRYFTKEKLQEDIKNKIIDVSNQFITYGLFNGINVDDLIELKMSDLDFENNEVKLNSGRVIKVDTLFKHLMIDTNDQVNYYEDGIEKESKFNKYTYGESIYVLKKCGVKQCDQVNVAFINKRLRTIKEQMENEFISTSSLYRNGLISYIKEQYAKKNVDLKTALFHEINKKLYTYDLETQKYINEFGSKMTVRMLRLEIKEYIDQL